MDIRRIFLATGREPVPFFSQPRSEYRRNTMPIFGHLPRKPTHSRSRIACRLGDSCRGRANLSPFGTPIPTLHYRDRTLGEVAEKSAPFSKPFVFARRAYSNPFYSLRKATANGSNPHNAHDAPHPPTSVKWTPAARSLHGTLCGHVRKTAKSPKAVILSIAKNLRGDA